MTNEEKAAVLLLSLKEETAAAVMKNLAPSEIRRVGKCMNRLKKISNEDLGNVAREFCAIAGEKGGGTISVRDDVTKNIVLKALGENKGEEFFKTIETRNLSSYDNPIIEKLRHVDPMVLMDFTKMEHPQTMALLLAHLKPEQTAEILNNLPLDRREEIVKRIATLETVSYEFIEEMARTLESELIMRDDSGEQIGGVQMIAEILNSMNRSSEDEILESLERTNPDLAIEIRDLMFTFDDVFKLDDRNMRELLSSVSNEDLARALKVADQEMKEKVLKNLSKRAGEMLKEDIELMPPTRLSEVEKSQKVIIEIVKRMESEGKITIAGSDEDSEFV